MEIIRQTSKEYFRTLSIIHIALVMGPIFFGIIILLLSFQNKSLAIQDEAYNKVLLYIVSAFYAIGVIVNPYIFRSKLGSIKNNQELGYKVSCYRSALITRYAVIEGLAYFSMVATMLTNQFIFIAYTAFSVLMLIYWRPAKENLITDLELNRDEIDIINDSDAIIAIPNNTRRY